MPRPPLERKAFAAVLNRDPELKKTFFDEVKKKGDAAGTTFEQRAGAYAAAVQKRYQLDKPLFSDEDVKQGFNISDFEDRLSHAAEVGDKKKQFTSLSLTLSDLETKLKASEQLYLKKRDDASKQRYEQIYQSYEKVHGQMQDIFSQVQEWDKFWQNPVYARAKDRMLSQVQGARMMDEMPNLFPVQQRRQAEVEEKENNGDFNPMERLVKTTLSLGGGGMHFLTWLASPAMRGQTVNDIDASFDNYRGWLDQHLSTKHQNGSDFMSFLKGAADFTAETLPWIALARVPAALPEAEGLSVLSRVANVAKAEAPVFTSAFGEALNDAQKQGLSPLQSSAYATLQAGAWVFANRLFHNKIPPESTRFQPSTALVDLFTRGQGADVAPQLRTELSQYMTENFARVPKDVIEQALPLWTVNAVHGAVNMGFNQATDSDFNPNTFGTLRDQLGLLAGLGAMNAGMKTASAAQEQKSVESYGTLYLKRAAASPENFDFVMHNLDNAIAIGADRAVVDKIRDQILSLTSTKFPEGMNTAQKVMLTKTQHQIDRIANTLPNTAPEFRLSMERSIEALGKEKEKIIQNPGHAEKLLESEVAPALGDTEKRLAESGVSPKNAQELTGEPISDGKAYKEAMPVVAPQAPEEAAAPAEGTELKTQATKDGGTASEPMRAKVRGDAEKMVQVLGKVLPGAKVVPHETPGEYIKAVKEAGGTDAQVESSGFFLSSDGSIHLNMADVESNTGFHEGIHPILDAIEQKGGPEAIDKLHEQLSQIPGAEKYVQYGAESPTHPKVEAITEFLADVADGKVKINPGIIDHIKDFVARVLEFAGMKVDRPSLVRLPEGELKDLARGLVSSIKTGKPLDIEAQAAREEVLKTKIKKGYLDPFVEHTQAMLSTGMPDEQVQEALKNHGFSEDMAKNIVNNAKTRPVYRPLTRGEDIPGLHFPDDSTVMSYFQNDPKGINKMWSAVRGWKGRWWDAAKGFPDCVLPLRDERTGEVNYRVREAVQTMYEVQKLAKAAGFKTQEDWAKFDTALRSLKVAEKPKFTPLSDDTAINLFDPYRASEQRMNTVPDAELPAVVPDAVKALPEALQPYVYTMRAQIDGLSRSLVVDGLVSPEQAMVIEQNIGSYMTRSYRAFNEKNWAGKVPQNVKDEAFRYLFHQAFAQVASLAGLEGVHPDGAGAEHTEALPEPVKNALPAPAGSGQELAVVTPSENGVGKVRPEAREPKPAPTMSFEEVSRQAGEIANRRLREILDGIDSEYGPDRGMKTEKGKDLGVLQIREDLPEPIKKLLGEYTDPGANFVMTIAKLSALKAGAQYMIALRKCGLGTIFFEEHDPNRPASHSVSLRPEGSETFSPLNGLYTTPEFKEVMDAVEPTRNALAKMWQGFIGFVRYGKTVLSPITQFKNFESNIGFGMMNGHLNLRAMGKAGKYSFSRVFNGDRLSDADVSEIIKENLVGQNVSVRELQEMFSRDRLDEIIGNVSVYGSRDMRENAVRGIKKPFRWTETLYGTADDFWKIYGYLNERHWLSKALFDGKRYEELAPEEMDRVRKMASERVKNTYPTWDRVWEGAKFVSKNVPLFGNFIAFQAESIRTLLNTFHYALTDAKKDPKLAGYAGRRLMGIGTYLTARTLLVKGLAQLTGMGLNGVLGLFNNDDEDKKLSDFNRYAPDYQRAGDKITFDQGQGVYRSYDLSSLDPYGIWWRVANAYTAGDEDGQHGVRAAMQALLSPFLEQEMLSKAIMEAYTNVDAYGRKDGIYEPDDLPGDKFRKQFLYVLDKNKPAVIDFASRWHNSIQSGDYRHELTALIGARGMVVDFNKGWGLNKLKDAEETMDAINSAFYRGVSEKFSEKTDEQRQAALKSANERMARITLKLHGDYLAAIREGADKDAMDETMKMKRYSKDVIRTIQTGELPGSFFKLKPSKAEVEKALKDRPPTASGLQF
jgi:hypothetical protein